MKLALALVTCTVMAASAVVLPACEKKPQAPAPNGASTPKPASSHEHKDSGAGHGGAVIQLGASKIGVFDVKVTRDEGNVVAGKDAPIDATLTPSAGATAKPAAVRFWIGTEDAKGSVKAKASVEDPKDPNRWHTHAEVPNPIPAGAKLWVEIEDDKGGKSAGSFDLKM